MIFNRSFLIPLLCAFFFLQGIYAQGKSLKLGANAYAAPYVLKDTNSGIYLDIITKVLSSMGYQLEIIYLSNERVNVFFEKGFIDMALYYSNNFNYKLEIYPSESVLSFKNAFVCIEKEKCTEIQRPGNKLKMIGFQNAKKFIDDKYKSLVEAMGSRYTEVVNQREQVVALLSGEVDVVFMDLNIFKYYLQELKGFRHPVVKGNKEVFHDLWPVQPSRSVAFKDKELRDRFNKELRIIKKKNEIEKIYKKYNIEF